MRPVPLFAAFLILAGCSASQSELPDSPRSQRTITDIESIEGGTYTVEQIIESNIRRATLAGTPDAAWSALPGVLQELGVPVTMVDPRARILGTRDNRVRRIGESRPSRYLDCGSGLAGQYANIYDVYLTLVTQVFPAEEGSFEVRTQLEAAAKDAAHSNNPVRCTSKGVLEAEIVEGLRARVGSP